MRRGNIQKLGLCLTVLTLGASLESCSKRNRSAHVDFVSGGRMRDPKDAIHPDLPGDSKPETQVVTTEGETPNPNVRLNPGANKMMTAEVTLRKDAILDREFLYGSDLQYSAINDSEYELVLQSLALGHVPVRFKIFGNTLQLLADQRLNFESDINHPERLVHEFKIVSQTADDVTIEISRGSPLLATVLGGPTAPRERSSWIRSLEYVSESRLLMFESSLEGADGSVLEFMESIMPREAVVPAGVKPLLADADREPMAERFRFLGAGPVYMDIAGEGRVKTQAASRYLLTDQPIKWYITPNVPDEYLPEIKTGIEGWNRYSQKMWGRDMIQFAGKLPDGVKLGDPRYNVVNWDNVAMAGAAYESQATEPLSGIQSHSLVYLPLAWINIGKDYWEKGGLSEAQTNSAARVHQLLAKRSFMDRKLPVNCIEDATAKISLEARQNPDAFAKELLKGVLMHEVGHALGLAHNFKGSLSMDLDDDATSFSTSIMDYNQYALERAAYESVESDKGPLLEYDRQILSVLYNSSKDLEGSAVLPACENGDMDDVSNGADPLCIPYDSGKDPTEALLRTIALTQEESATLKGTRSLPRALLDASGELGLAADLADVDEVLARLTKHAIQVQGLVTYYVGSGAQSLNYMTRANVVSLYTTKPGIVPQGYDIDAMRSRAWTGLTYVANLERLPEASEAAFKATFAQTKVWLQTTKAFTSATADEQTELLAKADSLQTKVESRLWKSRDSVLSAVRSRVLGEVKRVPTAPFHLDATHDFEALSLSLLEKQVLSPLATGDKRSLGERGACVIAMSTFKDVSEGRAAVTRVKGALESEARNTAEPRLREESRALLNFLSVE